jgi:hypothetical protein
MKKKAIISLCDYTGIMAKPWEEAGYAVFLVDPQHESMMKKGMFTIGAKIDEAMPELKVIMKTYDVKMVFAFPPCTDLAVSGAGHFEAKAQKDPHFQTKAMMVVEQCRTIGELSGAPYMIENPVSVISSAWRKPDFTFHPYEYGGYLPEDDRHPLYPDYIAPRDAYPKKTCLWTGNGFKMPEPKPVPTDGGYSTQHLKLGGKSLKTKNIRSATPRGFSQAVFEANNI